MKDIKMRSQDGSVVIVGGGCGEGLLTEAAERALAEADVLLYDDLVDLSCLTYVPEHCRRIYAGKRFGRHSAGQETISALLVKYAKEGFKVVRLKGGDPFVFGRGGEEILALKDAGIPYEVIPGVSSAIAVPEHMGIPVTYRKVSRSFTVVTGHTADSTGENFSALAGLEGTLVFLMGLHTAPAIAEELIRNGKDPETPCSILSRGFTPQERRYDCILRALPETARKAETPAVIVIGPVSSCHLESTLRHTLAHTTVIVTGTEHFTRKMSGALKKEGAFCFPLPVLDIRPVPQAVPDSLTDADWLVFTSANAISLFFEELRRRTFDARNLSSLKFAVIGRGTYEALAAHGIYADFVPSEYRGEVLGRELGDLISAEENSKKKKEKILILRAENGSKALADALKKRQIGFEDLSLYRTSAAAEGDRELLEPVFRRADFITFSSAAGVRAFFEQYSLPEKAEAIAIGPSTAEEFRRHSDRGCLVPQSYTADAMIGLMKDRVLGRYGAAHIFDKELHKD